MSGMLRVLRTLGGAVQMLHESGRRQARYGAVAVEPIEKARGQEAIGSVMPIAELGQERRGVCGGRRVGYESPRERAW